MTQWCLDELAATDLQSKTHMRDETSLLIFKA